MNARIKNPDRVFKTLVLANGAKRIEHYDLLGRLQQVDEPDGSTLRYRYEAHGELEQLRHSSGARVHYRHGEGGLSARTDRCETRLTFDANGYPQKLSYTIDGHTWHIDYQRNGQGSVTAMRYPRAGDWLRLGRHLCCGERCYAVLDAPRIEFANGACCVEEWEAAAPPVTNAVVALAAPRRLQRVAHVDASGAHVVDQHYRYDAAGRVSSAGARRFAYDAAGRLSACDDTAYTFDDAGRLRGIGAHIFDYGDAPCVAASDSTRYEYDALGRRSALHDDDGTRRYRYNLFGQLASVILADGVEITYLYDGFGRLIGRQSGGDIAYYLVDFEGRRIADANARGEIVRSYLWFGNQCIGAVAGVCGGALQQSFHRVHGGTLAAIGDADGNLRAVPHADPYGTNAPVLDGVPGYANLFGDPATDLLYARSRWLDPALGQFISADSWFGTHALERLPRGARRLFDLMPGGTGRLLDAKTAYDWCARDPVNFCDPNGHNFMGLIWSTISAFLWSMQVTSIAFQMELISLVIFILATFPGFMPAWNLKGWKRIAPWNGLPPLVGSTRLMVPFAFPLNSIWNAGGQVFTMGNVIWVNGDQMSTLEETSQRDLIECSNADTYRAATEEVAADTYRARSATAIATAAVNAAGTGLTGFTVTTPAAGAIGDVFSVGDWLSIRLHTGGEDELRKIAASPGATVKLDRALPDAFFNQAADVARIDPVYVHLQKDDVNAMRTLTFIRGQFLHFSVQLPEALPTDGLTVIEYMPAGVRASATATSPPEAALVRVAAAGDQSLYAVNDFLRIRAGDDYSARVVTRRRGSRDLILDQALPTDPSGVKYHQIEIAKMTADGSAIAGQTGNADRVNVGAIADLRKRDGVGVDNTGGSPVTTARRIVTQVLLDCTVAALPAALQGVAVTVERMTTDTSKQATGKNSSATEIDTAKDQAGRFSKDQPVRVRKAPNTDFFTTLADVDAPNNKLTLSEALPAGDFPNGTAVTVVLLAPTKSFAAENTAAPGTSVLLEVERPGSPAQNDVIRVRDKSTPHNEAMRQIGAAPTVVAQLDSNLPASHTSNLSVQRFTAVASTVKGDAAAPLVQLRFTVAGLGMPFAQNDELYFSGNSEGYGKVFAAPVGQVIELLDPIEFSLGSGGISVIRIAPTGAGTTGAKLKESQILIPSNPGEDPINRRRAVESHEMRHVWQYSVLGPFFFSMPIPWLINLGFSAFGSEATGNSANKIMRHIGLGGLDSLFALIAWGIGAAAGDTSPPAAIAGTVTDASLKVIRFPADADVEKIRSFTEGSPCEAKTGDYATYNVIDKLEVDQKRVTLRFALEADKFAVNGTATISVSPFEKIRATVNKWFSLNLEELWSQYIPVSWGRVLSKFLNRDSWFPLLGLYPLGFAMAGGNQSRMHFEQDASYHSGDVYNNFAISEPAEIFVGQFSRVFGFISGRGPGDTGFGLSDINMLEFLTVETPSVTVGGTPLQPTDLVIGSVPAAAAGRVRFREKFYMHMRGEIENAVGAFFAASQPGPYILHVPGELPAGTLVTTVGFDADFQKLRTITVKALGVSPAGTAADPVYETETVRIKITGDQKAKYDLQYHGAAPTPALTFNATDSLLVTVPAGAIGVHTLDIKATYQTTDAVFHGAGQLEPIALTADQLNNICQALPLTVQALAAPSVGPVEASKKVTFQMPIAPASVTVTSAKPTGAATNASVIFGAGRPASITFFAPNAVKAATDVTFDMVFGSGANSKTLTVTVHVTPAPASTPSPP